MPCELLSCLRDLRGRHRRGSVESVRPRPDRAVDRVSTAPRCVRVGLSIAGWRAGLHGKGWLARAPSPSAAVGLSLRPSAVSVGGPPPRPPPGSRHGSRAVGRTAARPAAATPAFLNLKDQTRISKIKPNKHERAQHGRRMASTLYGLSVPICFLSAVFRGNHRESCTDASTAAPITASTIHDACARARAMPCAGGATKCANGPFQTALLGRKVWGSSGW